MAQENALAGEQMLRRERPRAATSRFYYAAYQAVHALLLTPRVNRQPPNRGNWDHGPLANVLRDAAWHQLNFDEAGAESLRKRLMGAKNARVTADYGAGDVLQAKSVESAQKAAVHLIALAHRNGADSNG